VTPSAHSRGGRGREEIRCDIFRRGDDEKKDSEKILRAQREIRATFAGEKGRRRDSGVIFGREE
jgi:hypothetical protein